MFKGRLSQILAITVLVSGAATFALAALAQDEAASKPASQDILYRNAKYGFCVGLPQSWQGYSIVVNQWNGDNNSGPEGANQTVEHGPLILIRHPLWTEKSPRQDIPVMVFTRKQWKSLEKDEFHIGAAPIGPEELGRSRKYVFALPARYNFAYLTGFEEVDKIIHGKSFHAPCTH